MNDTVELKPWLEDEQTSALMRHLLVMARSEEPPPDNLARLWTALGPKLGFSGPRPRSPTVVHGSPLQTNGDGRTPAAIGDHTVDAAIDELTGEATDIHAIDGEDSALWLDDTHAMSKSADTDQEELSRTPSNAPTMAPPPGFDIASQDSEDDAHRALTIAAPPGEGFLGEEDATLGDVPLGQVVRSHDERPDTTRANVRLNVEAGQGLPNNEVSNGVDEGDDALAALRLPRRVPQRAKLALLGGGAAILVIVIAVMTSHSKTAVAPETHATSVGASAPPTGHEVVRSGSEPPTEPVKPAQPAPPAPNGAANKALVTDVKPEAPAQPSPPPVVAAEEARSETVSASEVEMLAEMKALLANHPRKALRLTRKHTRSFGQSKLAADRDLIAIEALMRMQKPDLVKEYAAKFRQRHKSAGDIKRLEALLSRGAPAQ